MQRNLAEMAHTPFDLLIIGGGIIGAAIAWDASLRGLSVGLVEKQDFAGATTAASSRLIHGGLRYLRNFEFGLVRESLRERRIWQRIAPHMVTPLNFYLPTASWRQGLMLRAGLALYDLLSFDRNRGMSPDKILPGHRALTPVMACKAEPLLKGAAQYGALSYFDCQMQAPERLAFAFLAGAVANGAQIANYARVTRLAGPPGQVGGVHVSDGLDGAEYVLSAPLTINAAGPWADGIAVNGDNPTTVKLLRSKGVHLITRPLSRRAIAVIGSDAHFFILPWRGHSILATTDTPFTDDPDNVRVTEADIAELLAKVNQGLPMARLTRADVLHFYAGLRPLVADPANPGTGTYGASRGSEIFDHAKEERREGLISALGGKWTTSRHLAEQVVDLCLGKLRRPPQPCRTEVTPLPGAMRDFPDFLETMRQKYPHYGNALIDHLASAYGADMDKVLALIREDAHLAAPLAPHLPETGAQIVFAARHELAMTLEDAVFRRTGLCTLGHPGAEALEKACAILSAERGWDAPECARQIAAVERRFTPGPA
ncbi:MAG: glycerol-3-phosphate dehydrogenase/oxidase [Alphaproteobacteria bacterium]|nr:glycerol-3-phosphate dehydrogenase/oxidase [Alphaproteobacteria bacterium]